MLLLFLFYKVVKCSHVIVHFSIVLCSLLPYQHFIKHFYRLIFYSRSEICHTGSVLLYFGSRVSCREYFSPLRETTRNEQVHAGGRWCYCALSANGMRVLLPVVVDCDQRERRAPGKFVDFNSFPVAWMMVFFRRLWSLCALQWSRFGVSSSALRFGHKTHDLVDWSFSLKFWFPAFCLCVECFLKSTRNCSFCGACCCNVAESAPFAQRFSLCGSLALRPLPWTSAVTFDYPASTSTLRVI